MLNPAAPRRLVTWAMGDAGNPKDALEGLACAVAGARRATEALGVKPSNATTSTAKRTRKIRNIRVALEV
jgi:hypothetical protein